MKTKAKLTLSVDSELTKKAKDENINISKIVETNLKAMLIGICPECKTEMFNDYLALLSSKDGLVTLATIQQTPLKITSLNITITGVPMVNVNGRKYQKLTVDYTCKHCKHKWREEDLT